MDAFSQLQSGTFVVNMRPKITVLTVLLLQNINIYNNSNNNTYIITDTIKQKTNEHCFIKMP